MTHALHLADATELEMLGITSTDYRERNYERTQAIAEAAHFLGFDGLVVPSARWKCQNLVLFMDRMAPADIVVAESDSQLIDWAQWHKSRPIS